MKLTNQDKVLIIVTLTTVAITVGGLVLLTSVMSVGALRAWAIVSVFAVLFAGFVGWRLGTRDARMHLSGLNKGIGAVMGAASKTADLRTTAAGRVRQVTVAPTPVLSLPDPEIVHVKPVSDEEVIDL